MPRTPDQALRRLQTLRQYYDAGWTSRQVAEPAASELLWILGYEELSGGNFLDLNPIYNEEEERYEYL